MGSNGNDVLLARIADAGAIASMSRDLIESGLSWSWRESRVRKMIADPEVTVLVARGQVRVGAFAMMEFREVHAHLVLLAVMPTVRRRGIASSLLQWLEESARVAGLERIQLEVRSDNGGAIAFYHRLGFVSGETLRGYYQGQADALRMSLALIDPEVARERP